MTSTTPTSGSAVDTTAATGGVTTASDTGGATEVAAAAVTSGLTTTPAEPIIVASAAPTNSATSTLTTIKTNSAAARSGAGMNLGTLDTVSPEIPTIDLMKRAGAWYTGCYSWTSASCKDFTGGASGFNTLEAAKLDLDANGWIKSLPANTDTTVKYRFASTVLSSGVVPNGKYIVRYDGSGTLSYSGVAAKVAAESSSGRDVVQVTNSSTGGFFLTISATDPANYLRNIRVYLPGGACAGDYSTFAADATACTPDKGAFVAFENFPASKPWYPPFASDLKGFRTLRFMDWMKTNTSAAADWATRPQAGDRTWSGAFGVPIEKMIDLANDMGSDPWMNVPTHATDDYVHQFARLAHQRLSPTLNLNLEYSNEAWNYAFSATNWMKDQAALAWPAEIAKGTSVYTLELDWYAQRLAQICTIAKQEFGADASRVKCVANTQAANSWGTNHVLACPYAATALGKACAKYFDAVAIAPYFGYYISNMTYRPTVASWYGDADGGLAKLFTEINGADANGNAITAPLAALSKFPGGARGMSSIWMTTTKAVADTYGIPMWAYEGGQHLVPPNGDTDASFLSLIIAANRDARMTASYAQDISDWKAAGGQTFAYYSHVAVPSKYGIWGVKESLTDNANVKWKAVAQTRDAACWWTGC